MAVKAASTIDLSSVKDITDSAAAAQTTADGAQTAADAAQTTANAANTLATATDQHFFADAEGAHVTDTAGQAATGQNVLINSDGMKIRSGTDERASFTSAGIQVGSSSSAHLTAGQSEVSILDGTKEMIKLSKEDYPYPDDTGQLAASFGIMTIGTSSDAVGTSKINGSIGGIGIRGWRKQEYYDSATETTDTSLIYILSSVGGTELSSEKWCQFSLTPDGIKILKSTETTTDVVDLKTTSSSVTAVIGTIASYTKVKKYAKIVTFSGWWRPPDASTATGTLIMQIPEGYRPSEGVVFIGNKNGDTQVFSVGTNGDVTNTGALTIQTYCQFNATWILD